MLALTVFSKVVVPNSDAKGIITCTGLDLGSNALADIAIHKIIKDKMIFFI
jgi:hypothetical protein